MADNDTLQENKGLAATKGKNRTIATAVPLRIRHTDEDAASGTVQVTATSVELVDDATTSYSLDISATYTSVAELVSAVNSKANWEAIAVDAIGGQTLTTNSLKVAAATAATGTNGVSVLGTTTFGVVCASIQGTEFLAGDQKNTDKGFVNELQGFNFKATHSSGTNTVSLYGCEDDTGTDTLLYSEPLAATSSIQELSINETLVEQGWQGGFGKRLVAVVAQQTVDGTLNVVGKSYRGGAVIN